jgi:hypothetical protein
MDCREKRDFSVDSRGDRAPEEHTIPMDKRLETILIWLLSAFDLDVLITS